MQREDWFGYTGNERDSVLEFHWQEGDWIQPIKNRAPGDFDDMRIYPILKEKKGLIILKDDFGNEREINLKNFKYITIQQKEFVKERAKLNSVNL